MSVFSRVRAEHVGDLISQAQMQGLEHHLLSIGEGSDWATLQFTSEYAKISFDELARQSGVTIESDLPTLHLDDAISAVAEGEDPRVVHDLMIESPKGSVTQGMRNAYNRLGAPRFVCSDSACGTTVPSYGGRYPTSCPSCGSSLNTPKKTEASDSLDVGDKVKISGNRPLKQTGWKKAIKPGIVGKVLKREVGKMGTVSYLVDWGSEKNWVVNAHILLSKA